MAIWDSNPQICRVIFENFNGLLVECAEKICGEVDIPISRLSNAIERVEIEAKQVAVGPSFTVFVVNHVLLPRLQVNLSSCHINLAKFRAKIDVYSFLFWTPSFFMRFP